MASESSLDSKLVDMINSLVKNDEILGEKQLLSLSRKIGSLVETYRSKKPASKEVTIVSEDDKSKVARHERAQSQSSYYATVPIMKLKP
jgi:hypothetical protein